MLVKLLYAVVIVLVLAIGWQVRKIDRAYDYLENQVSARSYGADAKDARVTIIAMVDYSSTSSRDINAALMQAVASVPDARVVFSPLPQPRPLPMKAGPSARTARAAAWRFPSGSAA